MAHRACTSVHYCPTLQEMVTVRQLTPERFEVTVSGSTPTKHLVTVSTDYGERLTGGESSMELLISKSFEFLLEREPNTSILSSFDLPLIGRYFPEYEVTIVKMLRE